MDRKNTLSNLRLSSRNCYSPRRGSAFTMAEILISLTIIGIIAAITLPALRANINETTWNTQRKALYSRMSQAISMMPSLNGYGIGSTDAETNEKAALAFVTDGLNKVLQINNICDRTKLKDCGVPDRITAMGGSKFAFPTNLTELNPMFTRTLITADGSSYTNPQSNINTNAAAFETKNGESIAVFYNPLCQADMEETIEHYIQPKMCANFIYDLNGRKGPNKVGKDIGFITVLYSVDPNVVAPMPLEKDARNEDNSFKMAQTSAAAACIRQDKNSRVPNIDELTSIYYNKKLCDFPSAVPYWSSSILTADSRKAWAIQMYLGHKLPTRRSNVTGVLVRCIKR